MSNNILFGNIKLGERFCWKNKKFTKDSYASGICFTHDEYESFFFNSGDVVQIHGLSSSAFDVGYYLTDPLIT
jgi:hypothetical protein